MSGEHTLKAVRGSFIDVTRTVDNPEEIASALRFIEDGLLLIKQGKVEWFGEWEDGKHQIPDTIRVRDYRGKLIVPGFVDTHIHYPQSEMVGAYGEQLLEWLNKHTFPTERRYEDLEYAREMSAFFIKQLLRNGTTTALVFGTVHPQSVDALFEAASHINMRMSRILLHQLTLTTGYDGSYRVEGTVLNQRLCLFHWLRRGFRLCPSFITSRFTPALKSELKRRGIARNFYDDTNLQALVNLCSRRLQKRFETRDIHFLCLYLQYCLLQHHAGITPQFNPLQRRWAESCLKFQVAQEIGRHWQRRALQPVPPDEPLFMALLFSMLRVPDPLRDAHQRDRQLRQSIKRLVNHFRELGNVRFYDEQGLCDQLYTHLAQALNRSLFAIGIDNTLPEEFARL